MRVPRSAARHGGSVTLRRSAREVARAASARGVPREPWVDLPDGRALSGWSAEDVIAYKQVRRQRAKAEFFADVFDFLGENGVGGDYHEYGCHRARTFRMALTEARRHGRDDMRFFAFDSFEGLPAVTSAPSVKSWRRGALSTSEGEFRHLIAEHGLFVDRCVIVKGFYGQTLTPARQRLFKRDERPIALACVDCDLYESGVPVFRFIEGLLQEGSVLYIDDLFTGYRGSPRRGLARAFREFERRSRFRFVPHLSVGWWGRSYIAYRP